MRVHLKPLNEQVIVLTGATSGIGLCTARMAAQRGAKLVLAARSTGDLKRLEDELTSLGTEVEIVPADVGDPDDVDAICDAALSRFGTFDTWINDAGGTIIGRIEDISDEDNRRLFDTNFWGVVYGSKVAVRHLKKRGGALINLGSLASERAFPLNGMYVATKHAVKGFTDTLRMELEEEGAPVSVTLIRPAAIDTPFPEHAKKYIHQQPTLPPPLYPVEEAANAILSAAVHSKRDIYVGGASKVMSTGDQIIPRLLDWFQELTEFKQQKRPERARDPEGALHEPRGGLRERGHPQHRVHKTSLYTRASLHPVMSGLVLGVAGAALVGVMGATKK